MPAPFFLPPKNAMLQYVLKTKSAAEGIVRLTDYDSPACWCDCTVRLEQNLANVMGEARYRDSSM